MSFELKSPPPAPKVVAGQVVSVQQHPNGDYIRLAKVDIGSEVVQIVFGGPALVREGDFVPVALPGARLPGRRKMRRTSFRGESSHGMFCSAAELGWEANGPDEVAILRPLEPGTGLQKADWPAVKADETAFHRKQRALWQRHRYGIELGTHETLPDAEVRSPVLQDSTPCPV